jgi:hypothetical protein
MVCLRNISVDTLHKGETEDNNNNNNKRLCHELDYDLQCRITGRMKSTKQTGAHVKGCQIRGNKMEFTRLNGEKL